MSAATYDEALRRILADEGGYSNDAGDPGGPTKYGITIIDARKYWKPNATAEDVRGMPLAVAKDIYRKHYWAPVRGDELPPGVDYAVMDYGVNSGIGRPDKVLRRQLGVPPGPLFDDALIAAIKKAKPATVAANLCDERLAFLQALRTWPTFGKGWGRRVAGVRAASIRMAVSPSVSPQPVLPPGKISPQPAKLPWWAAILNLFKRR